MSPLPMLSPREVVRALMRAGFIKKRQRGSQLFLHHPGRDLATVVAMHARDIPPPTLAAILKQVQLTEDRFREFL